MRIIGFTLFLCLLSGCGGGSSGEQQVAESPIDELVAGLGEPIPDNRQSSPIKILFIGNSHVGGNNLAEVTKTLLESSGHTEVVSALSANFKFLDEKVGDGVTAEKINSDEWTHVVLQAQKYSQSGTVSYSTNAAEYWVRLVKSIGATPILFPEHPQKGNGGEATYVYDIHKGISEVEASCVAPVGFAWDHAIENNDSLPLYLPDGNHADTAGVFLTALVFYQVITGDRADYLSYQESVPVDSDMQLLLRQVAADTVEQYGDCVY